MLKKVSRKQTILFSLFLILMSGLSICGCQKQVAVNSEEIKTEEVKLEEGQSIIYGQIVSINGNEISYYPVENDNKNKEVLEEEVKDPTKEKSSEEARREPPEGFPERGELPEGFPEGELPEGFPERGELPEGFPERGELPERFPGRGELPEGFPQRGELPEGFPEGELPEGFREEKVDREKQLITVQVPVGTKVTTRLGTETTFSRLASGDNIKMLVQKEEKEQIILEIWIVD